MKTQAKNNNAGKAAGIAVGVAAVGAIAVKRKIAINEKRF